MATSSGCSMRDLASLQTGAAVFFFTAAIGVISFSAMAGKHIIFLGAGASISSGYPSAAELRILTAGPELFRKLNEMVGYSPQQDNNTMTSMREAIRIFSGQSGLATAAFREGGFGSLDEFCKLWNDKEQPIVDIIRRVTRVALGIRNPELDFEKSDYYSFIQNGAFLNQCRQRTFNYATRLTVTGCFSFTFLGPDFCF